MVYITYSSGFCITFCFVFTLVTTVVITVIVSRTKAFKSKLLFSDALMHLERANVCSLNNKHWYER